MKDNVYTTIKNNFIEDDNLDWFINLDKSVSCYNKIVSALKKPLKLVLFYGKPGSGKTFLLNKIKNDLKDKNDIIFFSHPFFSEKDFIYAIYARIFGDKNPDIENFENFLRAYSSKFKADEKHINNQKIVILDEAQLYPPELIEKIRLMADSRFFKFLFTIHKTENEDLLAKDYFQTRIWESIELKSAEMPEIRLYIQKKIENFINKINFNDEDYQIIYNFTDGNLRNINKLMYKFFEICESYEVNQPSFLTDLRKNYKILHMAAISLGIINA
ncbi:ATP-binding protein [Campylobacter pinnipediorum]|uniref:AAA family ATPase n=1 Tax=Campylobacter pinnipediorum subsp. pinnipediorum TaxID=1660067 RepID=A0AAX0L9G9_9BACT|nr:ATP-binding protein [Campylobacter pinnipediorum]AQW82806.1 ATPase, AAA family [Campylobacter pinnipediorum subsp. pinnipediorum]OPA77975.1 AAA family ATPase [Campylobacter pinnipediorum subsp. pinnipediorum]OPA78139.1 AAA family ATPase [Campylobacter pinnipediorum subsp. pinnipediorum]